MNDTTITLLFLNAGRRVELIRSFRAAFQELGVRGRIVTTDINGLAPALYLGDARYILPHAKDTAFLERLCDICKQEKVNFIVPLIDPDLLILTKHRKDIETAGIRVLLSPASVVDICSDKYKTYKFLKENGFPTPEIISFADAHNHSLPLFIKPRYGSASNNTFRINNLDELNFFIGYVPDALIQEFIEGNEFTTDVFSDLQGEPIIAVPRRRLKVRAGEVSVGRVERNSELETLCKDIARRLQTIGAINIQAIQTPTYIYITEINPRFGGGCPLSTAAGVPFAKWTLMLALNLPICAEGFDLKNGMTTLRFDDSFFYPWEQLL